MIYDCFIFYNELDLLELRFNILDQHVDKFVLVECNQTFSGSPKPFFYDENQARFSKFHDKIIHVKVFDDGREFESVWEREIFQKNQILRGLTNCLDDDVILMSDVDEIPNPDVLVGCKSQGKPVALKQLMFYYNLNNLNKTDPLWYGTVISNYKYIRKTTPYRTRILRKKRRTPKIDAGGWHFSYLGDKEFIANKIRSISHSEHYSEEFYGDDNIERALKSGQDLFGRNITYTPVPLDNSYPQYLLDNIEKYSHYIREVPPGAESASKIAMRQPEIKIRIRDRLRRMILD